MECCVNALVTSFKETILAECPGMIKRNETESEYGTKAQFCNGQQTRGKLLVTCPNTCASLMMHPHLSLLSLHVLLSFF